MESDRDYVKVTEAKLSVEDVVQRVSDGSAGGIATFIGTTRDNFEGKKVVKLEYEAYVPMAEKQMVRIAEQLRGRWREVAKVGMVHRIGTVPVGEASVIVAVSSTHRQDCLEAVHWAIDELKATVPIWKKEYYEGGESSIWKENKECFFHSHNQPQQPPSLQPHQQHHRHHHPPEEHREVEITST
ncbi:Molybdopterin synthase catalytic subunit [Balamuthia mandrillaris]